MAEIKYNRGKRIALGVVFAPFLLVAIYLLAALAGAFIPAPFKPSTIAIDSNSPTADVYLLTTLLHVDIAIPATPAIKKKFDFLQKDGFPLDNPQLAYLVIGWGARDFYTSTKNYSDIGLGPAFKAIVGDSSVIHVIPSRDISEKQELKKLTLSYAAIDAMADNMLASIKNGKNGLPLLLHNKNHGLGDLFYQAKGNFNIFHPCNIWAARMLRSAGVHTGIWTPTTYSLMLSLNR